MPSGKLICTPFSGQPEKGVFMRYSHEYKIECIESFKQGRWPETPPGISEQNFKIDFDRRNSKEYFNEVM